MLDLLGQTDYVIRHEKINPDLDIGPGFVLQQ